MAYGTTAGLDAYWLARGYTVAGINDTRKAQLLAMASVFIDGLGWRIAGSGVPVSRFPGKPTGADQEHQWPRSGAKDIYGNEIADSAIPGAVKRAVYEAAFYEGTNGGTLNAAIRADQSIVREKVDVLEVQYSEGVAEGVGIVGSVPVIPAVMAILAPVLTGGSNPYGITGVVA